MDEASEAALANANARTPEEDEGVSVYVCLSVCVFVNLSLCVHVCLSVCYMGFLE